MKKMTAMILEQQGPIESRPLVLKQIPIPEPGPDEVLIKVSHCAVCRTDLHVIEGDLPSQISPLIPGHQAIGIVVKCGPHCQSIKVGDTVGVAWLGSTCESCIYCLAGKENLCLNPRFTGYHRQGGYAEYMTAIERYVYPLSSTTNPAQTSPLLCAGIIGYRALKRSQCQPEMHLGLFGFGSSAHIIAQLAVAQRIRLSVVTRSERHQELAKELGATWVGSSSEELFDLLDCAILFAPAGDLIPPILLKLKRGGILAVAGIHLSPIPKLDYEQHLFYEKDLRSVTANTREDGRILLSLCEKYKIKPRIKIYNLREANQALIDLKQDKLSGTAILEITDI